MSAFIASTAKCIGQLFTPAYYKQKFWTIVANNRKDIRNNSIKPLFKLIGVTWVTGYIVNYTMIKRFQVYPRQAALKQVRDSEHH